MSSSLHILAVSPFHTGSHRSFLESVARRSRHRWTLITGKGVHWKWRMRSAPLTLADQARTAIADAGNPDVVFCTDMLDLPQWRGMLRDQHVLAAPTVVYFHESQWDYPLSPGARIDHHYAYTNLLTALAADECWFNSEFHQRHFLSSSQSFVNRMPDGRSLHDLTSLEMRCRVIPPGFDAQEVPSSRDTHSTLTIGWVSRWESDKRPDRFADLLDRLKKLGVPFRLVLLGSRPEPVPRSLQQIRQAFASQIVFDDYAATGADYRACLGQMDVVVSTADHEFFGIGVCEAIWAGAAPVLPNRLSYPELVPPESLYDSLDEAAHQIMALADEAHRRKSAAACRASIEKYRADKVIAALDDRLNQIVG